MDDRRELRERLLELAEEGEGLLADLSREIEACVTAGHPIAEDQASCPCGDRRLPVRYPSAAAAWIMTRLGFELDRLLSSSPHRGRFVDYRWRRPR